MKFRKKPVVIDAVQWDGSRTSWNYIMELGGHGMEWKPGALGTNTFYIKTLEGDMLVGEGDWIIKGVKGEIYSCKPDIFRITYEPVYD